jgi:hypothetical protein
MLTTPTMMRLASRTLAVTNPRAAVSLCRFATGNNTTAVPMPARATTTSESAAHSTLASLPAPRTNSALVRTGLYRKRVGMDTNVIR